MAEGEPEEILSGAGVERARGARGVRIVGCREWEVDARSRSRYGRVTPLGAVLAGEDSGVIIERDVVIRRRASEMDWFRGWEYWVGVEVLVQDFLCEDEDFGCG